MIPTHRAYQCPNLSVYLIILVCLVLILMGLVATAVMQISMGINLGQVLLGYGFVLMIVLVPILWLAKICLKEQAKSRRIEKAFSTRGVVAEATIVDKEMRELGDSYLFLVFYQFRPDFRVELEDTTWQKIYWNQTIGSKLKIIYLPDDPTISKQFRTYENY